MHTMHRLSSRAIRIYNNPQLSSGASDMPNPNVTVLTVDIPAGNITLLGQISCLHVIPGQIWGAGVCSPLTTVVIVC